MKSYIGLFLISLPFIGIAVSLYKEGGMEAVAWVFGMTALVVVPIAVGLYLLQ